MDFHSPTWKDEVRSKTFVPGSAEAGLVAETVKRVGQVVPISGHEESLTEIITVAVCDAQAMIGNRIDS